MAEKIIVSLVSVFSKPRGKRARKAIARIRAELAKRFHQSPESVFISQKINSAVFSKGFEKIPRRVSLLVEQDNSIVRAYLEGEKIPKKKEEKKKEKEEKKGEREKEEEEEIERKKREKRAKEVAAERAAIKRKTDRV